MKKILDILNEYNEYDAWNIINPRWEEKNRVYDWRNYIPKELQNIWKDLSADARTVAYYMAKENADKEEWD